jgi:hypothetical protein
MSERQLMTKDDYQNLGLLDTGTGGGSACNSRFLGGGGGGFFAAAAFGAYEEAAEAIVPAC